MFDEDSAAVTAAIRAGNIQQIQAEPTHRRPSASNATPRVLIGARAGAAGARR
ncbi:MAG: hypothetical protein QM619_07325 [Micropruina sp.]|uniref:hypothetical protein n=1 Tax=Micropruina sp. TaxID=2737536 RepID=UPI0039E7284E